MYYYTTFFLFLGDTINYNRVKSCNKELQHILRNEMQLSPLDSTPLVAQFDNEMIAVLPLIADGRTFTDLSRAEVERLFRTFVEAFPVVRDFVSRKGITTTGKPMLLDDILLHDELIAQLEAHEL